MDRLDFRLGVKKTYGAVSVEMDAVKRDTRGWHFYQDSGACI